MEDQNAALLDEKVFTALRNLRGIRMDNGAWVDASEKEGAGFIKTCEALECFFTPLDLYSGSKSNVPKIPLNIIKKDLTYILDTIDQQGWPPSPYLFPDELLGKEGFKKGETDFTDAVSFAFTTLIDGALYLEKFYQDKIDEDFKKRMILHANESLQWLKDNIYLEEVDGNKFAYYGAFGSKYDEKGAGFNHAGIYFTYSGAVALAYAVEHKGLLDLSSDEINTIKADLNGLRNWLFSTVIEEQDGTFKLDYSSFSYNESFPVHESLFIYVILADSAYRSGGIKPENDNINKLIGMANSLVGIYKDPDKYGYLLTGGSHTLKPKESLLHY